MIMGMKSMARAIPPAVRYCSHAWSPEKKSKVLLRMTKSITIRPTVIAINTGNFANTEWGTRLVLLLNIMNYLHLIIGLCLPVAVIICDGNRLISCIYNQGIGKLFIADIQFLLYAGDLIFEVVKIFTGFDFFGLMVLRVLE